MHYFNLRAELEISLILISTMFKSDLGKWVRVETQLDSSINRTWATTLISQNPPREIKIALISIDSQGYFFLLTCQRVRGLELM